MKVLIVSVILFSLLNAQEPDLYVPVNIQKAYAKQTRSQDGQSGAQYWHETTILYTNKEITELQ